MCSEEQKLHDFLSEIQLDQFYETIVRKLHVTRISHFEHVEDTDLSEIGMSKPEQRRLFGHLKKSKRQSFKQFFKKSVRRDSEKGRQSASPPKDFQSQEPLDADNPLLVARNNIQQGLKCLIQQKDLILGDFLGKGAFGYVRKGIWTSDKGIKISVAVKCLKPNHDEATVLLQGEFIKEANAMSKLDHPNLIRLYGIVLTTPMMLVTELAPVGSLLARLRKEPEKFLISILCSFVVQIVSGMKYLEENRFIHRDLAARNILLVSYEKIKIGDFGLMRALPSDADYYVMQPKGLVPFAWCATECLKYRRFSHASDVWAFGVTLIEIFSYGQEPWPGLNGSEILERIDAPNFLRPERPDHCPVEIYKIMKNHCWCDNAEERSSFEALEKMFLQVLPKEIHATCDHVTDIPGHISFKNKDLLTIIESSHGGNLVKVQNRLNGRVGYVPIELFSSTSGNKLGDIIPNSIRQSLSKGKPGKESLSVRSRLLEPDTLSVVSRGSSSSSGSNSSSEATSAKHHVVHSKPKDIPFKRQSTFSSGVGSSGPSCASSYKDESVVHRISESDYGSQEDSTSSFSTRPDIRSDAGDRFVGTYENTMITEPNPYENVSISGESPPVPHSRPISIPSCDNSMSSKPVGGSPSLSSTAHMLSLPCHNYEIDGASNASTLSNEIALASLLSNSAPTTRNEMKAIRSTLRKQRSDVSDEFSRKSSFGAYQQRKQVALALETTDQYAENLVYEFMKPVEEQYEAMEERPPLYGRSRSEAYQNFDLGHSKMSKESREICYTNIQLEQRTSVDERPSLPKKTYRTCDSAIPIPPRTYRRSIDSQTTQRVSSVREDSYENARFSVPARTYRKASEPESPFVLPPRTYQKGIVDQYENTDFPPAFRSPSSSHENTSISRSSTTSPSDTSYENCDLNARYRTSPSTSYENYKLSDSLDTPPPLPKKKSSRTESECSSSVGDSEMRSSSRMSGEETIAEFPTSEPSEMGEDGAFQQLNAHAELMGSEKRHLIDDSPIHEKLRNQYVTIWDGQVLTTQDDEIVEHFRQTGNEGGLTTEVATAEVATAEVATAELVPVDKQCVPENSQDCPETEHKHGLLQALLSPQAERSPKFERAQSEDYPVRPPRKNREKSARRYTTGTLPKEQSIQERLQSESPRSMEMCDSSVVKESEFFTITEPVQCVCEEDNNAPPLPPRIPAEMTLHREDSDYVEIDVDDIIGLETAEVQSGKPDEKAEEQKPDSEKGEGEVKTGCDSGSDGAASGAEKPGGTEPEKKEPPKKSNGRTKLQRIKSLLSGKVATQEEVKSQPEASCSTQCGNETATDPDHPDDDDEEKVRYVLHFVTPV